MIVAARVVPATQAVEINTYEQLRELDSNSNQLKTDAIRVICEALGARIEDVTNITVLKKGMTNRSFLFTCKNKKYIMRIPGEGTDQLIDRRQEAAVYNVIRPSTSAMTLPISTRITATRSPNFWRVRGFATRSVTKMSKSA